MAAVYGSEGTTTVGFTITAQGTVENPVVERSSGDEMLDLAALTCVKRWLYTPATKDGIAVPAKWEANVMWKLNHDEERAFAQEPRHCARFYGITHATKPIRFTIVAYKVEGGEVSAAVTLISSGDSDLDEKAVECVKTYRFNPTYSDGSSADGSGTSVIDWSDPDDTKPTATPPLRITTVQSSKACAYPAAARQRQAKGDVSLSFKVGSDGTVRNPTILRSSGDADLDASAKACLASWRYKPALLNDKPVEIPWRTFLHWIPGESEAQ